MIRRPLTNALIGAFVFAFAALGAFVNAPEAAENGTPSELRVTRFLLLDSRVIDKVTGAELVLGKVEKSASNPLFGEDKPWERRFANVYPTVVRDESDGLYKCLYNPFIVDLAVTTTPKDKRNPADTNLMGRRHKAREYGLCYATSADGIHWEKPNLGIVEHEGSTANNIVLRSYTREEKSAPSGCGVLLDVHETDPRKRWKTNFSYDPFMGIAYSPDGLHWSRMKATSIVINGTHNCVLWAEELGKYVTFTRRDDESNGVERRIARTESADFETWSEPEIVLQGPDRAHQTHDLIAFKYAGVYLGLLGVMVKDNPDDNDHHADARQHVELAWSPDGRKWLRISEGTPFIGNSAGTDPPKFGEMPYDWGVVFPSTPIIEDDRILIYYGAGDWYFFNWRKGFLALATLRPDGWAGYEPVSRDEPGKIETKALPNVGTPLYVSADIEEEGSIRVTVLSENGDQLATSIPIKGNVTDARVTWNEDWSFGKVPDKNVRLRFELNAAKLYSFSFD